jgi:hypothetical protein
MEGGLNTFLSEQKKVADDDCVYTLAQFDSEYELLHDGIKLEDAPPIRLVPRGLTSLFDAVGKTITAVQERQAKDDAGNKPIIMIVTDGCENNSVEWKADPVKALCEKCTADGWQFLYLGADVDAFAGAAAFGISTDNTINFAKSKHSVLNVMNVTSANVANYRTGAAGVTYTASQRSTVLSNKPHDQEKTSREAQLAALLKGFEDGVNDVFGGDHS